MSEFKIIRKEVTTEYGKEIVIIKQFNLNKDQYKNRIWVLQPKLYIQLKERYGWR